MENISGPPVEGEQLKFRGECIKELISRLDAGNSVLMTGLRRIGKSSVMKGVANQAPADWIITYKDMQHSTLPADLYLALLSGITQNNTDRLTNYWSQLQTIPGRITKFLQSNFKSLEGWGWKGEFNDSVVEYWKPLTKGIETIIAESDKPFVLILDEFPIYLESMLKTEQSNITVQAILGQLKDWRGYKNFRMLVGGSISLDRILVKREINTATINDFSKYNLPPLKHDEAVQFLQELAMSYHLNWYGTPLIEETLDLLGDYYPFFLQAFFQEIRTQTDEQSHNLEEILENHFIPAIQRGFFEQFSARLKNNYKEIEQKIAKDLLNFISSQDNYTTNDSTLRAQFEKITQEVDLGTLLYDLSTDEFLHYNYRTQEYSFATRLVARWWRMTRGRG